MQSKHINIKNLYTSLEESVQSITDVQQTVLQSAGDYEFAVFCLEPNTKQRNHYHTYGDIDIFTIVKGAAYINLAKIEKDALVAGSEERVLLKEGDTYSVGPYTLHGLEALEDGVTVLNIAPGNHSAPKAGEAYQRSVDIFYPKN